MNSPVRRVALVLFVSFFVLALDVTYWQIIAADRLREHPDNPRVLISLSGRGRGQILSSDSEVLATSVPDPSDSRYYVREYPHGPLYAHTVGFSTRFAGDSGVEASHSNILVSGRDLTVSEIINRLLGEDPGPRSVQLTISHRLQQTAQRALGGRRGSIVAIDPVSGRLLALVSSPSFDPNTLTGAGAADVWEALRNAPDGPLVNRATGMSLPGELLPLDLLEGSAPDEEDFPGTALRLALRAAAIAGGGLLMKLHVVARVFDASSNLESATEAMSVAGRVGIEEARALQAGMDPIAITTESLGEIPGVGETGFGERVVWFAGFVPVIQPAIVVAVVVESLDPSSQPGSGSAEAASIGRAVMGEWLDQPASADLS